MAKKPLDLSAALGQRAPALPAAPPAGKVVQTTLRLPEPLYERLRTLAFERRCSMNELVIAAISRDLDATK